MLLAGHYMQKPFAKKRDEEPFISLFHQIFSSCPRTDGHRSNLRRDCTRMVICCPLQNSKQTPDIKQPTFSLETDNGVGKETHQPLHLYVSQLAIFSKN